MHDQAERPRPHHAQPLRTRVMQHSVFTISIYGTSFLYNSTCGSLAQTNGMKWELMVIFIKGLNCFSCNKLSSAHILQRQANKSWSSATRNWDEKGVRTLTVYRTSFKSSINPQQLVGKSKSVDSPHQKRIHIAPLLRGTSAASSLIQLIFPVQIYQCSEPITKFLCNSPWANYSSYTTYNFSLYLF